MNDGEAKLRERFYEGVGYEPVAETLTDTRVEYRPATTAVDETGGRGYMDRWLPDVVKEFAANNEPKWRLKGLYALSMMDKDASFKVEV